METNETTSQKPETELDPKTDPETSETQKFETLPSDAGEDFKNLDICPNCLEPNTDNLAVCKYCGMPLHPGADPDQFANQEDKAILEKNRAEAAPEEKKPAKKQESGFRRVMPWLGLYIIYYAITGIIETSRREDLSNPTLAYASWGIYIVAGLLMAWPLIKKGYRKLRHLPEEDEPTETTAESQTDTVSESETSDEDAAGEEQNEETENGETAHLEEDSEIRGNVPENTDDADLNKRTETGEAEIDESEFEEEDKQAAKWL